MTGKARTWADLSMQLIIIDIKINQNRRYKDCDFFKKRDRK